MALIKNKVDKWLVYIIIIIIIIFTSYSIHLAFFFLSACVS